MICGNDATLPDAGEGACCMGAAVYGPTGCTCWEPVHDVEQQEVRQGPPAVRTTMCADCAFRPGSPERSGDPRYEHSQDGELEDMVVRGEAFACHQGMRRQVALRHPAGVEIPSGPGAYRPPWASGLAHKANGDPADMCAGWAAARAALLGGEA